MVASAGTLRADMSCRMLPITRPDVSVDGGALGAQRQERTNILYV
jgi:hypothetical protein